MGILDLPVPTSGCPKGAVLASVDEEDLSEETLRQGLEAGGLAAAMYYGCWKVWKTDAGFSGELMQYRSVTDDFEDLPLDEALERASEWGYACYG